VRELREAISPAFGSEPLLRQVSLPEGRTCRDPEFDEAQVVEAQKEPIDRLLIEKRERP
jgi:hypothetical protein